MVRLRGVWLALLVRLRAAGGVVRKWCGCGGCGLLCWCGALREPTAYHTHLSTTIHTCASKTPPHTHRMSHLQPPPPTCHPPRPSPTPPVPQDEDEDDDEYDEAFFRDGPDEGADGNGSAAGEASGVSLARPSLSRGSRGGGVARSSGGVPGAGAGKEPADVKKDGAGKEPADVKNAYCVVAGLLGGGVWAHTTGACQEAGEKEVGEGKGC
eukprot:351454-Chlamydomonas_euryale.AAC.1